MIIFLLDTITKRNHIDLVPYELVYLDAPVLFLLAWLIFL